MPDPLPSPSPLRKHSKFLSKDQIHDIFQALNNYFPGILDPVEQIQSLCDENQQIMKKLKEMKSKISILATQKDKIKKQKEDMVQEKNSMDIKIKKLQNSIEEI
jgi:chromosome segregation ATPase